MILVLGSGFGLYGHLAALALEHAPVATLTRYREAAERRSELVPLLDRVLWVDDEEGALADAEMTCLVRRPADNAAIADRLCEMGIGGLLVIEKPVAPDPIGAKRLEARLGRGGRRWAVPYLFIYTDWYAQVVDRLRDGRSVRIDWSHQQSLLVRGWKQRGEDGGGALAFYFIHALALVEDALPGARLQLSDPGDAGTMRVRAEGDAGSLTVAFMLAGRMSFEVSVEGETLFAAASPFGPVPAAGALDPRIPVLRRFYQSVRSGDLPTPEFHIAVTRHWQRLAEAGD